MGYIINTTTMSCTSYHNLKYSILSGQFYVIIIDDVKLNSAARLDEITSDFHLGLGAFTEKPLEPFTDPSARLRFGQGPIVTATDYSYRHIVSLTDNITRFRVCTLTIVVVTTDTS